MSRYRTNLSPVPSARDIGDISPVFDGLTARELTVAEEALRALFANGNKGQQSIIAALNDTCTPHILSGPVFGSYPESFDDLLNLLRSNMAGSSAKEIVNARYAAASDLTAALGAAKVFGAIVTLTTPALYANNATTQLSISGNSMSPLTVALEGKSIQRGQPSVLQRFVVMAVQNMANLGAPAAATNLTVTATKGQASLVDTQTVLEVQSLTLRDIQTLTGSGR